MNALHRLTLLLAGLLVFSMAAAQTTTVANSDELLRIIAEAQESGAQVVVVQAPKAESAPAPSPESAGKQALAFRNQLAALVAEAASFPAEAVATIRGKDPDSGLAWPLFVLIVVVVYLVIGGVAERYFRRWGKNHFFHLFNPTPQSRAEKILYLLVRGLMMFAGLLLQLAIAAALVVVFASDQEHVRNTQLLVIALYGGVRALSIFFFNLLAPDAPTHRMLNVSDEDAGSFHRGSIGLFIIGGVILGICAWMALLDLQESAHKLSLVAGSLISTLLSIGFFLWQKRTLSGMITGPDTQAVSIGRRLFANNVHVLLALYFAVAWCIAAYRIVLDLPDSTGLIGGPVLLTFVAIAAYGVAVLFIEWAMTRRRPKLPPATDVAARAAAEESAGAETAMTGDDTESSHAEPVMVEQPSAFKMLFEHAAGVVVTVVTLWFILQIWGLDLAESGFLKSLWEIVLIGFLAYLAYSAVNIIVDQKIAEEGGGEEAAEHGDEGGAGGSRLGTLLPIFRNFLLIVIVVMAAMVALSEMGVDIAPLFAGAGVVGLAIGFGAQTLIADIFSGAFFLMDDAFRKGEYIDIGSVKGTVEKISIRSMQLRHHRGPLHTIPFSQIAHLTNYSRDWAIMKLPLRLTYDTDPEKVRKLIKKLGQELEQHPEFGGDFLQPLKSQGVYQMEDSAMIFRVKFMTKPGHQFTIRKEVYRRIRELFAQEGIKFAHREVTVRVADADKPLTTEQKEAVAGAVQPLLDAEQPAATAGDER